MTRDQRLRHPAGFNTYGKLGSIEIFASNDRWYWWRCAPNELPCECCARSLSDCKDALHAAVGARPAPKRPISPRRRPSECLHI
jgi:hypothetical protein